MIRPASPLTTVLTRVGFAVAIVIAVIIVTTNFKPKSRVMRVACVSGSLYEPGPLRPAYWSYGLVQKCELAGDRLGAGEFDDLLLCGDMTIRAWAQIAIRQDVQGQIEHASLKEFIQFKNSGHAVAGGGRGERAWACVRKMEEIECN